MWPGRGAGHVVAGADARTLHCADQLCRSGSVEVVDVGRGAVMGSSVNINYS
jgi:hypothetical protein